MYILDTNILRYYLTQPHNFPYMTAQIDRADLQHLLCITVINAQELMAFAASLVKDRPGQRENIIVEGYARIYKVIEVLRRFHILPFDRAAHKRFLATAALQTAIGTRDRRIAAVGLANDVAVVTANTQDFGLVPGLRVYDWTHPST